MSIRPTTSEQRFDSARRAISASVTGSVMMIME
jgi:hypothetical protein